MARTLVVAGADIFGEALKVAAVEHLREIPGVDVLDLGSDSYLMVAERIACEISHPEASLELKEAREVYNAPQEPDGFRKGKPEKHREVLGLIISGTDQGVSMVANMFPGIRATCCKSANAAKRSRNVKRCNVLSLNGVKTGPEEASDILDTWLQVHQPAQGHVEPAFPGMWKQLRRKFCT